MDTLTFCWTFRNLKLHNFTKIKSTKTYDSSSLYTTIPDDKLKSRLFHIIDRCILNKIWSRKFTYLVIGYSQNCVHKYSEDYIKKIFAFLTVNIYVVLGNHVFQQPIAIPMGTSHQPHIPISLFVWIIINWFISLYIY